MSAPSLAERTAKYIARKRRRKNPVPIEPRQILPLVRRKVAPGCDQQLASLFDKLPQDCNHLAGAFHARHDDYSGVGDRFGIQLVKLQVTLPNRDFT